MKSFYSDSSVKVGAVPRDSGGSYFGILTNPFHVLAQFNPGTIDSFGHMIVGTINNQVDVQFYRGTPSSLVTVTTGSGGTATASGGMATFAATSTASSFAKGVSLTETVYTAGAEMYCIFTAAFVGTGAGTSYQRIGLYDANNGFYIGKEANTFGISILTGGSATQTPKASFSIDTLVGGSTSKFTRNGTPEAIDLTKLNVWRIRFGWVGSAPIKFEVLSPDGTWVTFHEIKQPNLTATPSIADADLPVTCDVNSGNGGNAISILTNCWGAGTTQALARLDATLTDRSLVQTVRSVITGETTAGGGAYVNVKVAPSGALEVNATQSTSPWVVGGSVTANAGTNLNTSLLALESGGNLAGIATSLAVLDDWDESDRAKVNPIVGQAGVQGGSGTVSNTTQRVVLATDVALPAGTNPIGSTIPNQYELAGNTLHVSKYYTNAGAVTDGIIWSPAAGKRWYITDIFINVSAACTVTLEDDLSGGDSPIWKAELAANSGWSHSFKTPLFSGEDAADLLITTTAGNVYVMVTGYEV